MRPSILLFSILSAFLALAPMSQAQACGGKAGAAGCGCGGSGSCGSACGGGGAGGGCGCGGGQQALLQRDAFKMKSAVKWQDLKSARVNAAKTGKPMLVFFSFGSQSNHDLTINRRLFAGGALTDDLNSGTSAIPVFVPLWAMNAQERALAESLGYGEMTMLAVVGADGKVMTNESHQALKTHGIPEASALLTSIRPLVN